jgi:hypothetical protein
MQLHKPKSKIKINVAVAAPKKSRQPEIFHQEANFIVKTAIVFTHRFEFLFG